ncbi:hypothetical protein [Flavobacterium sp. CS20]|jgi:hypothetical protein|uniref:hypothetical protein n=1 Tax=Flavobacterium sp. CS20 TaxID=2775246 RepID=UPI001B3A52B3|nr:hypothetical protein [Flavobacterium sp. CS20]QTY27743.1 hypothetical protein IGB25_04235 [Flavobacterium sp. CS20]
MKKIIFTLFLIGLMTVFVSLLFLALDNFSFYLITLSLTFLGVFLYPVNKNFIVKKDFLFFPFLLYILFSIINLLWINSYDQTLSILNLIFGFFGFGTFYLEQKKKLVCK